MTVHFIGAGPGAADLITVRGRDLIARCPVCLYAGSIVSPDLLQYCPEGARIVDTAPMSLDEIEAEYVKAAEAGQDVARLHSGDLSVWSAVAEQIRRLEKHGLDYTMTPGVPAFAAAAATLGRELTIPAVAQSLVLTRVSGRASPMPNAETLAGFGATGATLAIHLAIHALDAGRRGTDAALWRRLPGRHRRQGVLAGRAGRSGHAWRYRGQGRGRSDRAHGADLRRPDAGRRAISARVRSMMLPTSAGSAAANRIYQISIADRSGSWPVVLLRHVGIALDAIAVERRLAEQHQRHRGRQDDEDDDQDLVEDPAVLQHGKGDHRGKADQDRAGAGAERRRVQAA